MYGLTAVATATKSPDKRWRVTSVEGVLTFTENGTYLVHPVVAALADPATPPGLATRPTMDLDVVPDYGRCCRRAMTAAPR